MLISDNFKVTMILSGRFVLFMDPRKAYLGRKRSCYKVSLETMKRYVYCILEYTPYIIYITSRYFSTHLSLLDGHYGYNQSMDEYSGVWFLYCKNSLKTYPVHRHCLNSTCAISNKLARVPFIRTTLA